MAFPKDAMLFLFLTSARQEYHKHHSTAITNINLQLSQIFKYYISQTLTHQLSFTINTLLHSYHKPIIILIFKSYFSQFK